MIINHNIAALNTHRQLSSASSAQQSSMEKLSSGLRINKAGDDAAGLAISEKMRGQIRGLDQASRNSQDAISMLQTAEGALNETHDILQRMRELAVQSSNDTATQTDRGEIQKEVDQLAQEITRISNTSEFNTKNLLAGGQKSTFQIGANAGQNLKIEIGAMDAKSLGITSDIAGAISVSNGNTAGISAATITEESIASNVSGTVNISSALVVTVAQKEGTVTGLTGSEKLVGTTPALNVAVGATTNFEFTVVNDDTSADYSVSLDTTEGGEDENITVDQFVDKIKTALGNGTNGTAALEDGKLVIKSAAQGSDSSVTIKATSDDSFAAAFGFQEGSASSGSSTLSVTASQGGVSNTVTDVAVDDTTISFSGDFAGLRLTKNAGDVDGGTATLTIAKGTTSSAAVTAPDGSVTTQATVAKGISVMTQGRANVAITEINNAIESVSSERSKLGSYQNRLEHTINNLNTSSENLTAAESRIRDVDYALAA